MKPPRRSIPKSVSLEIEPADDRQLESGSEEEITLGEHRRDHQVLSVAYEEIAKDLLWLVQLAQVPPRGDPSKLHLWPEAPAREDPPPPFLLEDWDDATRSFLQLGEPTPLIRVLHSMAVTYERKAAAQRLNSRIRLGRPMSKARHHAMLHAIFGRSAPQPPAKAKKPGRKPSVDLIPESIDLKVTEMQARSGCSARTAVRFLVEQELRATGRLRDDWSTARKNALIDREAKRVEDRLFKWRTEQRKLEARKPAARDG
jgi:hypothetical protein